MALDMMDLKVIFPLFSSQAPLVLNAGREVVPADFGRRNEPLQMANFAAERRQGVS